MMTETTSARTLHPNLFPNLIGVLQMLATMRVVLGTVFLLAASVAVGHILTGAILPLATALLVLAFVILKPLRTKLGPWHMHLSILLATLDVLLITGMFMQWFVVNWVLPISVPPSPPEFLSWLKSLPRIFDQTAPPVSPLLVMVSSFVLLIVICWQYDLRYAIGFIAATTLIEVVSIPLLSSNFIQVAFNLAIAFVRVVVFVIVAVVITYLVRIQNKQHSALLAANAKLVRHVATVEELTISHERNRLARELHDTLAHTLSAASVQLEAAHSLWDSNRDRAHVAVNQAMSITRSGLTETRRALIALRASPLDDLGFVLALRELGQLAQQRSGAQVFVNIPLQLQPLPAEIEQALYRSAQEAFENIVRHAKASRVDLALKQQPAHRQMQVTMTIQDDGVGFDLATVKQGTEHFGLSGMIERIESLGGHVSVSSQKGLGTCISIEIERR
jgi:signal transduction histidine kinase